MSVLSILSRGFVGIVLAAAFCVLPGNLGISGFVQEAAAQDNPPTIGQLARPYRIYRRDVDNLQDLGFQNINEVRELRDLVSGYDPRDLSGGWIAHQAIVASRAPGFMETVRTAAQARGQSAFLAEARTNQTFMWSLALETAAVNFIFDGLYQDSQEAEAVAEVLRDRAMAYMDSAYGARLAPGTPSNAGQILAVTGGGRYTGGREYTVAYHSLTTMAQVLELAARLSLDQTTGRHQEMTSYLLANEENTRCIHWAQLNLNQCLAAARNQAEEAYCVGRHAVAEVSECWGWMVDLAGDEG